MIYEIRVKGCLEGAQWSDWFNEMKMIVDLQRGETILLGEIADQAELYGVLAKLRNLAMPLLLVKADEVKPN